MEVGHVRSGSGSDVGRRREKNEDSYLEDEDRRLFVVADGMGGHPSGEVASREAVAALDRALSNGALDAADRMKALTDALVAAHEAVVATATTEPEKRGMGTTAVVVHLDEDDGTMTCAHIGDSRAYVLAVDRFVRVTEDHVWGGQGGRSLTQAIGSSKEVEPEAAEVDLNAGDKILLCTDGLTDMLDDREIRDILAKDADAQTLCDELIASALDHGGVDNITCIVIEV
ncbi:MAG: protein phosphatase 2C domain-containing protein [Actinobacteria bacterium]|nr:protein phosphatase 2C domain-containing protein [Actinomycetota bacterium]